MTEQGCLFCRIANKEIPAKVVFEDSRIIAFEDVNPQAPVHILLIPKKHIEKISDLTKDNADMVGHLVLAANKIAAEQGIRDAGYRLTINCNKDAGQAVFHLHMHLMGGRKFAWPPG
ncbi:MAG: histidine triad nucleotide-binding protein [Candidatus Omnitrophica bacterium]|nr:histidine triad nucleotide-binding protein [Candidatus Omnitrophota bacterium]